MGCGQSNVSRRPKHRHKHLRRKDKIRREPDDRKYDTVPVILAEHHEFEIQQPQVYKSEFIDETTTNRKIQKGLSETNVKFKVAIYTGIHNVKVHHQDSITCRIRGAEFLPNGNFVACDQANQSLKLWNSEFKSLSHVKLSGKPHDLCVHSSNREGSDIFVTIPSERLILEFYIESSLLIPGEKIRTDGWCYGIAPYKTGLVVCVGTKVEFMDVDGNVFKILQYDRHGHSIFGSAFHVCVTPDHHIIVTDTMKQVVMQLNMDGEILFRYTELSIPHGAIADSEGNIYLCGADSEAVDVLHQITKGGERVKSLLSWRHVGFKPDVICYRDSDHLLAVCGDNDRIKTFKLETRRSGKIYSNDAVIPVVDRPPPPQSPERTTGEVQRMMKQILKS